MEQIKPYFMTNKEWYYFDENEWEYKLTNKATNKAKHSYNEFYEIKETTEIKNGKLQKL